MSDFDVRNVPEVPPPDDKPIPFDDSDNEPETEISHSPLDLGGNDAISTDSEPAIAAAPSETALSSERITGVKTFFTKLHAGSMEFMAKQINEWLSNNPGVVIKRTNVVVGEVASKKTEPNLIITVWY